MTKQPVNTHRDKMTTSKNMTEKYKNTKHEKNNDQIMQQQWKTLFSFKVRFNHIHIITGISVAQTINANILIAILDVQNIITMLPSADL